MQAEKLVPAVIAAVAVVCLLFAGRAHGQGYVPAAASQQMEEPQPSQKYLPQPEAMPMPDLLKRPPGFPGAFGGYTPTTTEPEAEPAAETMTEPEPEPVTPTAPGQGDFYLTGATPTDPEPPAKPSSPGSYEKSSDTSGGGASY